ncbi:LuxR C-terminal-related transcriptional regulator [Nonomuraea sp. NPDC049480]|uniref:LuxR C-terminal-related transcriptional regulator n=1 Tax=Nonomuraea sp. NPDC049480 TaxID=3364353 RepID=UPI0037AB3559
MTRVDSQVGADWPLLGREREMAKLTAALATGASGGGVLIGAAGMGRTRLAREVAATATRSGRATEWLVATRAAASLPFGATLSLLPLDEPVAEPYAFIRGVIRHMDALAQPYPPVVCIDDAHLLDDASAVLIHQLALRKLAFLLITVRQEEPVPDAVVALWKDGHLEPIELKPLPPAAVDTLIARTLGRQVDALTGAELQAAAAGNPLALAEALVKGLRDATLVQPGQVWSSRASLLTARERQVCLLAASGLSSRLIADRLVLSVRTVNNHLTRAYGKLGVSRRADLMRVLNGSRHVMNSPGR